LPKRDAPQRLKPLLSLGERCKRLQRVRSRKDEDQGSCRRRVLVGALDVKEWRVKVPLALFLHDELPDSRHKLARSQSLDEAEPLEVAQDPLLIFDKHSWEYLPERAVTLRDLTPAVCVQIKALDCSMNHR